jgi:hypothetical protein
MPVTSTYETGRKTMNRFDKEPSYETACAPGRACAHEPCCPPPDAADREAAQILVSHPEQGWSLLCNGVIAFDDTGDLLPDGRVIAPHRSRDGRTDSAPLSVAAIGVGDVSAAPEGDSFPHSSSWRVHSGGPQR